MEPNHTLPSFPANNTTNNRTPARRAHTSKIVLGSLGIAVASVVLAVSAFRSGGKATAEQQARLDAIAASVKELTTNASTGSIAQGNSIGSLDAKVSKSSADTIKEIDALRSDIKALANQVKKSAEDDAGKTKTLVGKVEGVRSDSATLSKQVSSLAATSEQMRRQTIALSSKVGEIEAKNNKDGEILSKRIDVLSGKVERLLPSNKEVNHALALAKDAIAKRNVPLAKIYYLNAINHAPEQTVLLNEYAEFVFKNPANPKNNTEELSQLRTLAQLALYRVAPENISTLQALTAKCEQYERNYAKSATLAETTSLPINVGPEIKWAEVVASVSAKNDLNTIWNDENKLADFIVALNEIGENCPEAEKELKNDVLGKLKVAQGVLQTKQLADRCDALVKELVAEIAKYNTTISNDEKTPNARESKILHLTQVLENTLSQIWFIDRKPFPEQLVERVNGLPKVISDVNAEFTKKRSRPYLAKIKELRVQCSKEGENPRDCNDALKRIQGAIKEIQSSLAKITNEDLHKEAVEELEKVTKQWGAIQKEQHNRYQRFVVAACDVAFKCYDRRVGGDTRDGQLRQDMGYSGEKDFIDRFVKAVANGMRPNFIDSASQNVKTKDNNGKDDFSSLYVFSKDISGKDANPLYGPALLAEAVEPQTSILGIRVWQIDTDEKAMIVSAICGLYNIDQSLLTPETSRLFNDVYGKLYEKMNSEYKIKSIKWMCEIAKIKLEDF